MNHAERLEELLPSIRSQAVACVRTKPLFWYTVEDGAGIAELLAVTGADGFIQDRKQLRDWHFRAFLTVGLPVPQEPLDLIGIRKGALIYIVEIL